MNPVGSNQVNTYANLQPTLSSTEKTAGEVNVSPIKVEQNKVTLSPEGKALLTALQEIDHESKKWKRKIKL